MFVAIYQSLRFRSYLIEYLGATIRIPAHAKGRSADWYLKKTEAEAYLNTVKARLEKSGVSVKTKLIEGVHGTNRSIMHTAATLIW